MLLRNSEQGLVPPSQESVLIVTRSLGLGVYTDDCFVYVSGLSAGEGGVPPSSGRYRDDPP